jgi:hypothetical protein
MPTEIARVPPRLRAIYVRVREDEYAQMSQLAYEERMLVPEWLRKLSTEAWHARQRQAAEVDDATNG